MKKEITILAVRQGEEPKVEMLGSDLKSMQKFVGGMIQMVPVSYDLNNGSSVDICCNEEGMMEDLPFNSCGILGPFFFTVTDKNGEPASLRKEAIEFCKFHWHANKTVKHGTALV